MTLGLKIANQSVPSFLYSGGKVSSARSSKNAGMGADPEGGGKDVDAEPEGGGTEED